MISIIIPVYNHEKELQRSLRSVAAQTYKDWEVIVVDDGSDTPVDSDAVRSIVGEKAETVRQENKGAPAARNTGLDLAKGGFVIFWDADVIADPQFLETMYKALQQHGEASYAYTNYYFGFKKIPAKPFNRDLLRERNFIHSTSLIRRNAAVSWDESLHRFQDWDLWLTMLEQGKTGVHVPEFLFHVLSRKKGMSSWLPRAAYRPPFRWLPWIRPRVEKYEAMRDVVVKKHGLYT